MRPIAGLEGWEERATPADWDAVFGVPGTLEVEIGAGKGGFAVGYCEKHPGRRLVAMEWRVKYAEMTQDAGAALGLKNLVVLRADAKFALPKLFAERSLDALHLYFPDPWWKRRHFKRRVVEPEFVWLWRKLLKPGGKVYVRTDVEHRGAEMRAILERAGFVNDVPGGGFAPWDPEEVPTSREHKYLAKQEPVWRLRLVNPDTDPGPPPPRRRRVEEAVGAMVPSKR